MSWFIGVIFFLLWWSLHRTLCREERWGWYYSLAVHVLVALWLESVDGSGMGHAYALIIALPMLIFGWARSRKNS